MNGRRRLLAASVISIQNSNFVYPSCQNCFSRLLLDSKRYRCQKCGCSGDARDTNYRYRLSLKVADARNVFAVTVFGSCLDTYFGVTAKGLQRYILELNQEAGEPDRDASSDVVIEAVETCFLGKKFVFGVKSSDKQDGARSLQHDCETDHCLQALTACQMFIPNPRLVGCTVIHYLQQRRCPHFKQGQEDFVAPQGLFMALDQPSIMIGSLPGSGAFATIPSGHIDSLSNLWPQSFALTSSSTSGETTTDPLALSSSKTGCDEQKWKETLVPIQDQSVYSPQDNNLAVNKRIVQEDNKCYLYSTWCDSIPGKSQPGSPSPLVGEDHRSLHSLLELEEKSSSSELGIIQYSCGPEKSQSLLRCQRQSCSSHPLASPSSHTRGGGNSQEGPWFEDELPSSESLNEFIAKIENDQATAVPAEGKGLECFPSQGTDDCHGRFNQPSPKLDANFLTGQPDEELQKPAGKVDVWKEDDLLRHQLNMSSFRCKDSQQEAFCSSLSTEGKEGWDYVPSQHPLLFPCLSPAGIEHHSKGHCLSSKEEVAQDASSHMNFHFSSSIMSTGNWLEQGWANCSSPGVLGYQSHHPQLHWPIAKDDGLCSTTYLESYSLPTPDLESPCPQARKKTTFTVYKCDGYLANWGNKGNPSYQRNQTVDIQEQDFTSATHEKQGEVFERECELFPENNYKGNNGRGLLQGSSDCPQNSYNTSADLFDASVRETEASAGIPNAVQAVLAQEDSMAEKYNTSELLSNELNTSRNTSPCGLSLQNVFTASDQNASSPVSGSAFESEHSLADTPGFVPSSQSTPLAKPRRQVRLPRAKESILTELPLNKVSWINAECKRLRPALKNPLVKQLVSKFLQPRRPSSMRSSAINASGPQQLCIDSPARELSENDGEEWIPPSERKWIQPLAFRNQKAFGVRRTRILLKDFADSQIMAKSPLSENAVGCGISLMGREFAPEKQQPAKSPIGTGPIHKDAANVDLWADASPIFCAFADVNRSSLPSTPCTTSNAPSWSPDLFADTIQLPSLGAVLSDSSA